MACPSRCQAFFWWVDNRGNGRALCVPRHRREHEGMSGDSTGSVFRKDYSWQERAVDALMTGISDFYNAQPGQFRHAFIVEVSPSGGKTKFSLKAAAKSMIDAHLIDKVIWVVPRETIKDGFKDDAEDTGLKIDVRLDTSYNGMLRN